MKAQITKNQTIEIIDHEGSPEFTEIFGGLGWADPQGSDHFASNWFVAIGVEPDQTFTVTIEESGNLTTLANALIPIKDNLFMKKLFVNTSEFAMLKTMRAVDGLFSYEIVGRHANLPIWKNEERTWPSFRSRSTVVSVFPVRPEIIAAPQIGLDLIHNLSERNRFKIRHECPRSSWIFRQRAPYTNLFRHPLFQAIVHSIYSFAPGLAQNAQESLPTSGPKLPRFGASS